ncbi:hypothetical protein IFM89_007304 [Coptis chinensis]|uniref:F-box domain-containing protein n=1 Tax=Coptis chinensis TaxID=261450 RepID=A0A835GY45_9MAGN|nr:hypothetical protein IFM89_007304 [Coptis chinensis]
MVEVDNLGDIALFVGLNNSFSGFSLVASDFPGCKANCIYFFTDKEKGVFNLEDGIIKTIVLNMSISCWKEMEKTKQVSLDSSCSWSQLPGELLSLINERLSLLDLIRFSCVCPTWRSVSASEISHRRYQLPWLILPNEVEPNSNEEGSSSRDRFRGLSGMYTRSRKQDSIYRDGLLSFYSILERKIYKVEIPNKHRICGTYYGWLLTIGENSDMRLFHPFTGKVLDLPPLKFRQCLRYKYRLETGFLYNATINTNTKECGICNIQVDECPFASWIALGIEREHHYNGLLYYKGEYYALRFGGDLVLVKGLDGAPLPTASLVTSSRNFNFSRDGIYLVATSSDLLKVTRFCDNSRATQRFLVHKLDFAETKWLEVESLSNCALFVGVNDSFSIVASDFPGCHENCIYFFTGEDKGIFNLQDGTIQTICPSDSKFISLQPVRFSANPI